MSINRNNLHYLHSDEAMRFDKYKALYKRFIDGTRWINDKMLKGINADQDKADFNRLVVEPMDAMWAGFTGGQDNVQGVAGNLSSFFTDLGFTLPPFNFLG